VATTGRRVAVLLNPQAQGVTARRLAWFRAYVPAADLFVPDGVDAARAAVRAIAARRYDVLCPGGGDGTFMLAAGELIASTAPAEMPALLPLRLGTGNAVHDVCAASPPTPRGLAHDLARAADPDDAPSPLRLLDVGGRITQFAGVGLDADWAADYAWLIKRHVGTGRLLPLVRGVPGYVATAVALTIPRLVRRPFVDVTLTAIGGGAARLGPDGAAEAELGDGAVIFRGPATLAAASTVPSYNAGMRFFRHVDRIAAERGDAFEVKVAVGGAFAVLRHAGRALAGEPVRGVIADFAVRGLRVELARPARYHVGGDVLPPVRAFTVGICPVPVPVLRGRAPAPTR
jgi:diacylglycerol kinase family enzyme